MSVVMVTGSSRGIGFAAAQRYARDGHSVILNGRDEERLRAAVSVIRETSPSSCGFVRDVSDYSEASRLFGEAGGRFGGVDILINNAGVSHIGLFSDMTPGEWERVLAVNLGAAINCSHLAIPYMLKRKKGCIINISSIWGLRGASCEAVYSAAKAGLCGFTKALAKELAPSGIRVSAIACGVIDTDMNACFDEGERAAIAEGIPMGRMGTAAEVAEVCAFLSSDAAEYLTGQVIILDGGMI